MTDQAIASGEGASAPVTVIDAPADTGSDLSVSQATRALLSGRERKPEAAESAQDATAEQELSGEDNADPETVLGETQDADPEELPPIERPRSWSKDADDDWNALPRTRQEKIAANEQAREADVNRRINEAAEKLKGLTAKEQAAEQARQQFEAKLSSSVKFMEQALQSEFGDIQTMNDVRKLQSEDPFRFQAWQVRQMELASAKAEESTVEQRQAQEKQSKRGAYEAEQNKLLIELVPDMADPKKAAVKRESAVAMLTNDLGLKMEDLQRWMQTDIGHEILSNAGIQKLMDNGLTLKAIQAAKKVVAEKPVPQVQRPGVATPKGSQASEQEKTLTHRFEQTGSLKDAAALRLFMSKRRAS